MKTYKNQPLARYTSLKVGGPAETLLVLEEKDHLLDTLKNLSEKVWLLGSGTNTLISDEGLSGTVVINQHGDITKHDDTLTVDSGVEWDTFVSYSIAQNLFGLEFMSGIPGTVGGAVVGNIAAYGQKVADTLIDITVYDQKKQALQTISAKDLDLEYRSSNLQKAKSKHLFVICARFKLSKSPLQQLEYESALKTAARLRIVPHSLEDRRAVIMETRKRAGSLLKQAGSEYATAGSFFRNPIVNEDQVEAILSFEEAGVSKQQLLRQNQLHSGESIRVSAAHVLLAAGFKRGQKWGNVRLHPDHILKIENIGGATAQDIYDVVEFIMATVRSKLGIKLTPEVQFLGKFD